MKVQEGNIVKKLIKKEIRPNLRGLHKFTHFACNSFWCLRLVWLTIFSCILQSFKNSWPSQMSFPEQSWNWRIFRLRNASELCANLGLNKIAWKSQLSNHTAGCCFQTENNTPKKHYFGSKTARKSTQKWTDCYRWLAH